MVEVSAARLGRVPRQRLYEQIAQQLFEHIGTAGLRPGDRLPPERELAARLGVSRASLAQALVALEVLGVVTVRHGDGVVVVEHSSDRQVVSALRAHRDRLPEVLEARAALEVKLAALAAERRTRADLRAIDDALAGMAADIDSGGRGVEGDERFHAAVTAAGHSALLARLMQEISDLIRESRLESLSQPGRPTASLAGHQRVADAIHDQDAVGAAAAMEAHIQLVSDVAVLREEDDARHG
ncbi:transcriptional regulator, GntR family [Modestobacter sp. DSM 44400]|uniref:FadR/GntR family transcriptional regulator n=1 Tax=Modestobacter sp. DSM 44400 TaxID=1550230 RepID=UPI000896BF8C|nr:FCD domain-containing protein [Modestobacter sp. DSM 44400]SDY38489.1 transcriptional regulator, GntR family [Modestobacter sp. DSM 44400]